MPRPNALAGVLHMKLKSTRIVTILGVLMLVAMNAVADDKKGKTIFSEPFNRPVSALKADAWVLEKAKTTVGDDGVKCLEVTNLDRERMLSYIYIKVKPGRRYSVACQVKTEGVLFERQRGATVFVEWVDRDKSFIPGGSYPMGIGGSSPWVGLRILSTNIAPESVGFAKLYIGLEGKGKAWFRDLTVSEYGSALSLALAGPLDKVVLDNGRPSFSWKDIGRSCQLVIASDHTLVKNRELFLVGSHNRFMLPHFLGNGSTWYWQVQERTKVGRASDREHYCSDIRSFTIADDAQKWPPILESEFKWSDDLRPVLSARVFSTDVVDVGVNIDGLPADVLSFKKTLLTFRTRQDLSASVHKVEFSFGDGQGKHFAAVDYYSNVKPQSRVSYKEGVTYVDDEAFFPIGAYCDPSDDPANFSGLVEAGFNLAHSYVFEREEPYDSLMATAKLHLERAKENNIKIFLGMPRGWIRRRENGEIMEYVSSLMTHSSLLAWYVMDEPAPQNIGVKEMENATEVIRMIDPFHPSLVAFSNMVAVQSKNARNYIQHVDIVGCDPYPLLRSKPFSTVGEWVRNCREMGGPSKPVWAIIEAFDAEYDSGGIKRGKVAKYGPVTRPSYGQMKCQAFLSLAAGADGVIFYWMSRPRYDMKKDAPVVWQSICKLVKELQVLESFMITPRSHTKLVVEVPEPFEVWVRSNKEGETAVAFINPLDTRQNLKARFSLGGKRLFDGDRMLQIEDGVYESDFGPYETKVYVLK